MKIEEGRRVGNPPAQLVRSSCPLRLVAAAADRSIGVALSGCPLSRFEPVTASGLVGRVPPIHLNDAAAMAEVDDMSDQCVDTLREQLFLCLLRHAGCRIQDQPESLDERRLLILRVSATHEQDLQIAADEVVRNLAIYASTLTALEPNGRRGVGTPM
jgi:hypothetical protein